MHFSGKEGPGESGVGRGQENKIMKANCTRLGGYAGEREKRNQGSLSSAAQKTIEMRLETKLSFFFFFGKRVQFQAC